MLTESRTRRWFAAACASGAALAFLAASAPPLAALAGLAASAALVLLAQPRLAVYVMVLSFAVSVQRFVAVNIGGLDTLSFYKFLLLGAVAAALLQRGLIRPMLAPAAALAFLAVESYAAAPLRGEVPGSLGIGPLKALFGLAVPFLLLLPDWRPETARRIRALLPWLAPASVAAGALLQAAGLGRLFSAEFTGVPRLQGANIAAHLAMLAFIGTACALYEICRNASGRAGGRYALALINFVILVATGTRGPLLAMAPIVLAFLAAAFRRALRRGVLHAVPLLLLGGGGAAALWLQLDNYRLRQSEKGLSGRDTAWNFFWEKANELPVFGRGLGAVLEANDGTLYSGFTVPHNEYLRFYYDGGLVGLLVMLAAFVLVYAAIARRLAGAEKWTFRAFMLGVCIYSFTDNTLSTIQFTAPLCCFLNGVYILNGGAGGGRGGGFGAVPGRNGGGNAHGEYGENEDPYRRIVGGG